MATPSFPLSLQPREANTRGLELCTRYVADPSFDKFFQNAVAPTPHAISQTNLHYYPRMFIDICTESGSRIDPAKANCALPIAIANSEKEVAEKMLGDICDSTGTTCWLAACHCRTDDVLRALLKRLEMEESVAQTKSTETGMKGQGQLKDNEWKFNLKDLLNRRTFYGASVLHFGISEDIALELLKRISTLILNAECCSVPSQFGQRTSNALGVACYMKHRKLVLALLQRSDLEIKHFLKKKDAVMQRTPREFAVAYGWDDVVLAIDSVGKQTEEPSEKRIKLSCGEASTSASPSAQVVVSCPKIDNGKAFHFLIRQCVRPNISTAETLQKKASVNVNAIMPEKLDFLAGHNAFSDHLEMSYSARNFNILQMVSKTNIGELLKKYSKQKKMGKLVNVLSQSFFGEYPNFGNVSGKRLIPMLERFVSVDSAWGNVTPQLMSMIYKCEYPANSFPRQDVAFITKYFGKDPQDRALAAASQASTLGEVSLFLEGVRKIHCDVAIGDIEVQ